MSSDASQEITINANEETPLDSMIPNDELSDEALDGDYVSCEIDPEEEALMDMISTNGECCGPAPVEESASDEKPTSPLLPERSEVLDTNVEEETLMKIVNANDDCCGLAPMESSVPDILLSEQPAATEEEALMNIVNMNDECCGLAPTEESEKSTTEITSEPNTEELPKNNEDEDDGVDITLGAIEASAENLTEEPTSDPTIHFTSAWQKIMHLVDPGNMGKPGTIDVYSIDLNTVNSEDKPWTKPGVKLSSYFNYSFTEESWLRHCKKRKENIEQQAALQQKVNTADAINATPPAEPASAPKSQDQLQAECVPVLHQNAHSVVENARVSETRSVEKNNFPDVKENSKSVSPIKPISDHDNSRQESRRVKVQESGEKVKSLKRSRERERSPESKETKRRKPSPIIYEQPERSNFDERRTRDDKRQSHHQREFREIERRDSFDRRERGHDGSDRYRDSRGDFDRSSNYYAREFKTETRVHNMIDEYNQSNERHYNRNRHEETHRSRQHRGERRW